MHEDKTNVIERLKNMEAKLGITLKGLFCEVKEEEDSLYAVKINGEIQTEGDTLEQDIDIVAILYDEKDRVIDTQSLLILSDNFLGYDVFSFDFSSLSQNPNKIRLFPKKV